ncbi:protein [Phaffia rhodozyma]|uniref:non-specific serine/threonine protein kinase n=1 Tax=Phaffia rhodozyma TaxID=264483 RepID=A0A0F7SPY4_PHARH|nr:protein [Phaffia rhodozyma]
MVNCSKAYEKAREGDTLFAAGNWDGALKLYTKAIELHPQGLDLEYQSYLFVKRSDTFRLKNDLKAASEDIDRALKLDPSRPDFEYRHGIRCFQKNNIAEAIRSFSEAIKLDPSEPTYFIGRASAYNASNEHQAAILDLDQAIERASASDLSSYQHDRQLILDTISRVSTPPFPSTVDAPSSLTVDLSSSPTHQSLSSSRPAHSRSSSFRLQKPQALLVPTSSTLSSPTSSSGNLALHVPPPLAKPTFHANQNYLELVAQRKSDIVRASSRLGFVRHDLNKSDGRLARSADWIQAGERAEEMCEIVKSVDYSPLTSLLLVSEAISVFVNVTNQLAKYHSSSLPSVIYKDRLECITVETISQLHSALDQSRSLLSKLNKKDLWRQCWDHSTDLCLLLDMAITFRTLSYQFFLRLSAFPAVTLGSNTVSSPPVVSGPGSSSSSPISSSPISRPSSATAYGPSPRIKTDDSSSLAARTEESQQQLERMAKGLVEFMDEAKAVKKSDEKGLEAEVVGLIARSDARILDALKIEDKELAEAYAGFQQLKAYSQPSSGSVQNMILEAALKASERSFVDGKIPLVKNWSISRREIAIDSVISTEYASQFCQGSYRSQNVIVRKFPPVTDKRLLLDEIRSWVQVTHPHILTTLGASSTTAGKGLYVVTKYVDLARTADKYFMENRSLNPTAILLEVAGAMHYLHHMKPEVLHEDLRATNIYITPDGHALVANFGLRRIKRQLRKDIPGFPEDEPRWRSPEVLSKIEKPSRSSDVYAFGMTCFELVTRSIPFPGRDDYWVEEAIIDKDTRPSFQGPIYPHLQALTQSCWKKHPKERPSFSEIIRILKTQRSQSGSPPTSGSGPSLNMVDPRTLYPDF